ncbi:hypothetical protein LDENG_00280540 [Lucifuga dentata]|nr:hypothetical protein LDENG_00280540 [Lucifuga dentata]
MDVVSPELNSLLPDEIMDTEAIVIEDAPPSQPDGAVVQPDPSDDTPVPMETDTPIVPDVPSAEQTQALTTVADSTLTISSGSQLPLSLSSTPSPLLTLKPALATSTAVTKTTDSVTGTSVSAGLQKLSAPFTISAANHQIILNKVASSQATEAAKAAGSSPQIIKQEGQKLLVTTIGKSGQPIVLQLPHASSKPGATQASGDAKSQTQQFKVVTIGGRSELKPVVGGATAQVTTLQAQQLKTVQVMFA